MMTAAMAMAVPMMAMNSGDMAASPKMEVVSAIVARWRYRPAAE